MNYAFEINSFYDWLEYNPLTSGSITLWHALMHTAYRSGRYRDLNMSIPLLVTRTNLSRSSIYKEREVLKTKGRIDYQIVGGRHWGVYHIIPFESAVVSVWQTQQDTQNELVSATRTQQETQSDTQDRFVSTTQTQHKTQSGDQCKQIAINEHNDKNKPQKKKRIYIRDINIIENDSLEIDQSNGNEAGIKEERFKKFKKWLFENAPSVEQMSEPFSAVQYEKLFNDYKRDEILSVLLAMHNYVPLKKRNKSAYLTARNWLDRRAKSPPAPATGQRIGQIKQPDNEERVQKLLQKLDQKK